MLEAKTGSITDISVVGITSHRVVLKVGYLFRRLPNEKFQRKECTHVMDNPNHVMTVNEWLTSVGGSDRVWENVKHLNVGGH